MAENDNIYLITVTLSVRNKLTTRSSATAKSTALTDALTYLPRKHISRLH